MLKLVGNWSDGRWGYSFEKDGTFSFGREASGNGGSGKWALIKNGNENILYLNGLAGDESGDELYNEKIEIIFIDMFHMKMIRGRGYEQNFEK
jgi:hypothetical protein